MFVCNLPCGRMLKRGGHERGTAFLQSILSEKLRFWQSFLLRVPLFAKQSYIFLTYGEVFPRFFHNFASRSLKRIRTVLLFRVEDSAFSER